MSLDFPNRADWLAIRCSPKQLPTRLIHGKGTFSADRNQHKRDARKAEAALHRESVLIDGNAPKLKRSMLMVTMLADRRRRQRHGQL